MAKLRLGISVLAAMLLMAAAAEKPAFLHDSTSSKVSTASYGPDNTEVSCMSQLNYKNCRWTGCPVERTFQSKDWTDSTGIAGFNPSSPTCDNGDQCRYCWPDSIIFQTDLGCCAKEHSYSYDHDDMALGSLELTDKVSTCDWEIALYRSTVSTYLAPGGPFGQSDPWTPIMTDDGNALKFGNAWGTCYLNKRADHCDGPLCDNMAIQISAGLYGACAYSHEKTTSVAVREDTCGNSANVPDWLRALVAASGSAGDIPSPTSEVTDPSRFESYLTYLRRYTCAVMAEKCGYDKTKCSQIDLGVMAVQEDAGTQAKIAYSREYEREKIYPGMALIISGPMYITGKKEKGLEETGMFEMALDFVTTSTEGVSEPINRWPMVRPKGAKIRFAREEGSHYEGRHHEHRQ